jgi:hypothetical protein
MLAPCYVEAVRGRWDGKRVVDWSEGARGRGETGCVREVTSSVVGLELGERGGQVEGGGGEPRREGVLRGCESEKGRACISVDRCLVYWSGAARCDVVASCLCALVGFSGCPPNSSLMLFYERTRCVRYP